MEQSTLIFRLSMLRCMEVIDDTEYNNLHEMISSPDEENWYMAAYFMWSEEIAFRMINKKNA